MRYTKSAGAVFRLKYHIVWFPKYRRKIVVDHVAARREELLYETAQKYEMTIHAFEIMSDHIHVSRRGFQHCGVEVIMLERWGLFLKK